MRAGFGHTLQYCSLSSPSQSHTHTLNLRFLPFLYVSHVSSGSRTRRLRERETEISDWVVNHASCAHILFNTSCPRYSCHYDVQRFGYLKATRIAQDKKKVCILLNLSHKNRISPQILRKIIRKMHTENKS